MADRGAFEIVGDPPVDERQRPTADYQIVSPTYFRRSTCRSSRAAPSTLATRATASRVCIVNEAFVRAPRRADRRSACGSRSGRPTRRRRKPDVGEIVGVAAQVKGRPDETKDFVQIYVPMAQDLIDDIYPGRPADVGTRRRPRAVGARRDRARRQGAARERPGRDDARGRRAGTRPRATGSGR